MSSKITWHELKNRSLILVLLGFASLIQFIILLLASYYFPINSIYVLIFLSFGITLLLTGAEIILAQIVHSFRVHQRQSKPSKKKIGLKKISEIWSIFIGAGIGLGLFTLIYLMFAYFLLDPFSLIFLPFYGKFTLVEIISGITLMIIILIFKSIIPQK